MIAAAVARLSVKSATIDGEAVLLGEDSIADFRKLHSRTDDGHVSLYAFDLIELDGEDLRKEPLDRRRDRLRTLLEGASDILLASISKATGRSCSRTLASSASKGLSRSAGISRISRDRRRAG